MRLILIQKHQETESTLFEEDLGCTRDCASAKDTKAVQQNCEVDLETHRIFAYGELLEDLRLEEKEDISVVPGFTAFQPNASLCACSTAGDTDGPAGKANPPG